VLCARAASRTGAAGADFGASGPGLNASEEVNETGKGNRVMQGVCWTLTEA